MHMEASSDYMKKDGLYSWVVLVVIVLNNFCCFGYIFANAGLYSEVYPDLLRVDQTKANTISSAGVAVMLFTMPLSVLLLKILGCQVLAGIGSVLTIVSAVTSAFAWQLWHLILGFSVTGGFGASLILAASIGVVPHYFERRKSAAYAAPALGSGIAMVAYPYIITVMLESYGYKLGGLYLSPLFLITLSAPLVFRPQCVTEKRKSMKVMATDYLSIFKLHITPFYLLNVCCWIAGNIALRVILFSYLSAQSQTSVAVLSYSLIGIGFLAGTFLFVVYLSKFTLNHFVLQVAVNLTLGLCSVAYAFSNHNAVYYGISSVVGVAYGLTVANMAPILTHLYPAKDVDVAYAAQEAFGGIAGFVGPVTATIIQGEYTRNAGLYYIAVNGFLAAAILVATALFKPTLWTPYVKRPQSSEGGKRDSGHGNNDPESKFDDMGQSEQSEESTKPAKNMNVIIAN